MARRIEAAQAAMADVGLDALLLMSGPNLAYLSGAGVVELTAGRAWYLLVPRSGEPALVVQDWRRAEAAMKSWVADVRAYRRLSKVPFEHLDDLWATHRLATGKVSAPSPTTTPPRRAARRRRPPAATSRVRRGVRRHAPYASI